VKVNGTAVLQFILSFINNETPQNIICQAGNKTNLKIISLFYNRKSCCLRCKQIPDSEEPGYKLFHAIIIAGTVAEERGNDDSMLS